MASNSVFRTISFIALLTSGGKIFCNSDTLTVKKEDSYQDWNWEAQVVENQFIKAAIVPSMGASMLQYDFGTDTFLLTNPATYGHVYDPAQGQSPFTGDWGFGGFEVWSTPENWPPSPVLTFGEYQDTLLYHTGDSLQLVFTSATEITGFPDIRYVKKYTAYKNSTLVRFENLMINTGANPIEIGMMNVAEVATQHSGQQDYSYFKAYFPIKKNSIFGNSCVNITPVSPAFQGEIAPGVYGVEYTPTRGKVFADSPEGWMAFVDERDTQTYVCLYEVYEGANYPDQGANTEVYIENNLAFLALEAISPLVNLNSADDTLKFTEYFASTKLKGRVLKANLAGAVNERLSYDSVLHKLTGTFGAYSKSILQILYCDSLGNVLEEGLEYNVTPDTTFILDETVDLTAETRLIKLRAFSLEGKVIADLDEEDFMEDEYVSLPVGIRERIKIEDDAFRITYLGHGEIKLFFDRKINGSLKIDLLNMNGQLVEELFAGKLNGESKELLMQSKTISRGAYLIRIVDNKKIYCRKLLI